MGQFFNLQDLGAIAPELELMLFGMILLIADLLVENKKWLGIIGLGGIAWSGYFLVRMLLQFNAQDLRSVNAYSNLLVVDQFSMFFKLLFLVAAALTIIISLKYLDVEREHHGEYYALILLATMGMMFMAGAADLITLYISLETMAIATYILVGFLRSNPRSNEASLKYFLLGAFSSGILLYGMSLLYGIAGSTSFVEIRAALQERDINDPIAIIAVVALCAGIFFKIAAVPFHQWTPDAYEGAPTSITAYMSVAVKAASFAMLIRLFMLCIKPQEVHWLPLVTAVSVLTMTVGNIAAMTQSNVKRLLAYSSISHAGYLLLGIVASSELGLVSIPLYLFVYAFSNMGVWAIIVALRRKNIIGEQIDDLNGLVYKQPVAAILMLVFLLSLAGIPPTAGFIAKYFLFSALIQGGHSTVAVIAVLNAAVSVYFYLRIVVAMFMKESTEKTGLALTPGVIIALDVGILLTMGIGLYPDPFIPFAAHALP